MFAANPYFQGALHPCAHTEWCHQMHHTSHGVIQMQYNICSLSLENVNAVSHLNIFAASLYYCDSMT